MKISTRWFKMLIERDCLWFRMFGYGLSVRPANRLGALYRDRNRLGACVVIGPALVRALAP